jgi:hypothetical protein
MHEHVLLSALKPHEAAALAVFVTILTDFTSSVDVVAAKKLRAFFVGSSHHQCSGDLLRYSV